MPVAWHLVGCHATGIFSLLISFLNAVKVKMLWKWDCCMQEDEKKEIKSIFTDEN